MRFTSLLISAAVALVATASPLVSRQEETSVFRFLGGVYCLVDSTATNAGPCPVDQQVSITYDANGRWEGEISGHNVASLKLPATGYARYNIYIDGTFLKSRDGQIELLFGPGITRSYDFDFNAPVPVPDDYVSPYPSSK